MYSRIVPCSHYFPGINALTVWQLTVGEWRLYAAAVDDIKRQQKEAQ